MKEYTAKQIKQLEKNPYVFKVTKHMIYYTAKSSRIFLGVFPAWQLTQKSSLNFAV